MEGSDEARFGRRQQIGEGVNVMAEGGADRQRRGEIDADDDRRVRRQSQLAGATKDHVPRLPAGICERLVLDVGTALAVDDRLPVSAGPAGRFTPLAVARAPAEVPIGTGPQPFFSSSSSSAGPRKSRSKASAIGHRSSKASTPSGVSGRGSPSASPTPSQS